MKLRCGPLRERQASPSDRDTLEADCAKHTCSQEKFNARETAY